MKTVPPFKKSSDPKVGNGKKGCFEKTPINAKCVHDMDKDHQGGERAGFTRKATITKIPAIKTPKGMA